MIQKKTIHTLFFFLFGWVNGSSHLDIIFLDPHLMAIFYSQKDILVTALCNHHNSCVIKGILFYFLVWNWEMRKWKIHTKFNVNVGSPFGGGVFHCRCERTQTQQAQYNEFGREAGLTTGPLWGLRQRSGRIIGEQDRQWRSWGGDQGPSSGLVQGWILLLLFWYSTNRTS